MSIRYTPNPKEGLNKEQIDKRISENLVNYNTEVKSKSYKDILFENFFTLFNFLNLFLGIIVFLVGSYRNMLFLLVVILNTAISTIQEIHSKRAVDKLSLIAQTKVKVIRDGDLEIIPIDCLVLDDIVELSTGNQVVTDCIVRDGEILVNESFITGEPNSITKKTGDIILSGSYIVSGTCKAQVEHIGTDNYTYKISNGAKYVKKLNSEIISSLKKIIKVLSFIIIPIGIGLFISQYYAQHIPLNDAIVQTVAAVIGMIPEGLVLLTSTILAVSVIRLSKNKVLVQDLYCIETLARVDTLCLDKTGTLTTGILEAVDTIPISFDSNSKEYNRQKAELINILSNIGKATEDSNATIDAIKKKYTNRIDDFEAINKVPFSSDKKWSGIYFKNKGSYILGAPKFIVNNLPEFIQSKIDYYAKDYRVLLIAHSSDNFNGKDLPNNVYPIGVLLIQDSIRKNAKQTISYFKKQNVDIKLISGDNPITVSQIAKRVGISNYDKYIDLSTLEKNNYSAIKNEKDKNKNKNVVKNSSKNKNCDNSLNEPKTVINYKELVKKYTIFGRVTPMQKCELIKAMKENGNTVAMTGDGVNDVLALKEADCSIAMINGSDASKNISQLVLLNNDFSSLPKIVLEGRRSINNIERSSSLFLVKTIYSLLLAIMVLLFKDEYPFIPIQLTLISTLTIGIPSFILALEPNKERIKGNYLSNIIKRALPTGILVVVLIFILNALSRLGFIPDNKLSSLCVLSTGLCGLVLLFTFIKSRKSEESKLPISIYRLSLAIIMSILFITAITMFGNFFSVYL